MERSIPYMHLLTALYSHCISHTSTRMTGYRALNSALFLRMHQYPFRDRDSGRNTQRLACRGRRRMPISWPNLCTFKSLMNIVFVTPGGL